MGAKCNRERVEVSVLLYLTVGRTPEFSISFAEVVDY